MEGKELFKNPFRVRFSPGVDAEVTRLKEDRTRRASESPELLNRLVAMAGSLIEMTDLLSTCVITGDKDKMESCATLAREVHTKERELTRYLVASGVGGKMIRGIIRFPYRLDRIADMLAGILYCCRMKAGEDIPFSQAAQEELRQLFSMLSGILTQLRTSFEAPETRILKDLIAEADALAVKVDEFRTAHWDRLEHGFCSPLASSVYRKILDAIKWAGEYAQNSRSAPVGS